MNRTLQPWVWVVLALLWLAPLGAAGCVISQRLALGGDLRKFMPAQAAPKDETHARAARAADARRAEAPVP